MPSAGLLWEMESLCERGEGGEDWGIAAIAKQEAFDLRAGILHVAGVCALLRRNIPAMHSEHLIVRAILCRKLHKLSLIHISEPTRQAEISYAVFCLKKKKKTNPTNISSV